MKTTQLLGIALLAISLGLSGCDEIETPVEPTPDTKPGEVKSEIIIDADIITNGLSFTSEKGEKSISFTTNEDWTLSIATVPSGDVWCTASAASGAKGNANVKFTVTENTSYDDRSVSVTIKSGTASKTFTITQKCVEAATQAIVDWVVEFNDEQFSDHAIILDNIGAEAYQIQINFSTNFDWSFQVSTWSGEGNWCYVTPASGSKGSHNVVLTILKNDTPDDRHATIDLRCKNENRQINVSQFRSIITEEAGMLKTLLDNIYRDVESLLIKGYLNGDDIAALREFNSNHSYHLKRLDLSMVNIVKGGSFEYKHLGISGSEWRKEICDEDNVIPDNMFNNGFARLEELILPPSVTSIGKHAFEYCSSLKKIELPNSITSIGDDAFYNCSDLEAIALPKTLTSIGSSAFEGCNSLVSIEIPEGVKEIKGGTFYWCRNLKNIKLPETLTEIGTFAFYECCWGLTQITIPKNVKKIGYAAFHKCNKLETVTCLAETAPEIKHTFTDNTFDYAFEEGYVGTLIVPKYCSSSYRTSDWRLFFGIHESND